MLKDNVNHFHFHAYDTIQGSGSTTDQGIVEAFTREAPGELTQSGRGGIPWSRDPDGPVSARMFGGMNMARALFAADRIDLQMFHALFQNSLNEDRIVHYDEWFVIPLLVFS
jgi:succinate dehydrogenase/fumarate reductase flavoprotein subunit